MPPFRARVAALQSVTIPMTTTSEGLCLPPTAFPSTASQIDQPRRSLLLLRLRPPLLATSTKKECSTNRLALVSSRRDVQAPCFALSSEKWQKSAPPLPEPNYKCSLGLALEAPSPLSIVDFEPSSSPTSRRFSFRARPRQTEGSCSPVNT